MTTLLRVLDLFSGIGGFSLGLERTGCFKTVAFCEIESFPRKVLRKHWQNVPIYEDVRTLTADRLSADGISVDVICGGFPCQDISTAGKGAGIEGERSGLWTEFSRLIGEICPQYVIVENVAALLSRGLDKVLGDLAAIGFDAEWHGISASAVGAPHRRDRIWIVAHAARVFSDGSGIYGRGDKESASSISQPRNCSADAADTNGTRLERWDLSERIRAELSTVSCAGGWSVEPDVDRVAHGISSRVDRLKGLGNAVVPQIPELIGRAIIKAHEAAA